jgi:hypothetical protein
VDFEYRIDLGEVTGSIDAADVVAIYFPMLRRTLLIDARVSELDGAMVKVVPMVSTPEERLRSLRKLRPRFARPESITIIPWPKYVRSLVRLGVWDHIVRRFAEVGAPEAVRQCDVCFRELVKLEREELRAAVVGEDYATVWSASGAEGEEEDEGGQQGEEGLAEY